LLYYNYIEWVHLILKSWEYNQYNLDLKLLDDLNCRVSGINILCYALLFHNQQLFNDSKYKTHWFRSTDEFDVSWN